jgi:glucose-6-phosphate isomerase
MPPPLLDTLVADAAASRLWRGDVSLFASPAAADSLRRAVRDRLGWLDAARSVAREAPDVASFARQVSDEGLTHVYLLGMGGSSLSAEVLRDATPRPADALRLTVLDTTDERAIGLAAASLQPDRALFLVASKSGSTIEVASLERHFWALVERALGDEAGRHFAAITDPGTPLVDLAGARRYRHVFLNPPDIGGRYSALSRFGLVPAALLGVDLDRLATSAAEMAAACQTDAASNPALTLAAFMAEHVRVGRDKLTIALAPPLAPLGAWIEQLVAESTGKLGTGVLPVVDEPPGDAARYGSDRAFVLVHTDDDQRLASWRRELGAAGHPVFEITADPTRLGAEFVRWEVATALAGAALGVNPFDEPNVRAAKTFTERQLDAFLTTGALAMDPPLVQAGNGTRSRTNHLPSADTPRPYVAILDYLPADRDRAAALRALAAELRDATGWAVTHGVGPRYLHSTGQYHKGGPNTGRFVLVTSDDATITLIPETGYSFSVLKHAQALGDFDALSEAGRAVLHVHFSSPDADVLATLGEAIRQWVAD